MKVQNEFKVAAAPAELFDVLADVERVAPCMPGATLEDRDADTYTGAMRVRVGPINARYRGSLRVAELDKEARRAVMTASGSEVDGQGNAEATITATIEGTDSESVVRIETDMQVRGRAAQFGRGVLANVSQRLIEEFARNLEATVLGTDAAGRAPDGGPEEDEPEHAKPSAERPAQEPEALDALAVFVTPLLKQYGPVLAGLAVGLVLGRLLSPGRVVVVPAPPEARSGRARRRGLRGTA
jgi:uncharacterized protein